MRDLPSISASLTKLTNMFVLSSSDSIAFA
nr:MAG TPA: hypothetical protein [Caudoviricetes sp.]